MASSLDLVLRFSSLGDIVLTSGFLRKLRSQNSERILFVTEKSFSEIVFTFAAAPDGVKSVEGRSFAILWGAYFLLRQEHLKSPVRKLRLFDLHGVPKTFFFRLGVRIFCWKHRIPLECFRSPKRSFLRWMLVLFKIDLLGKRHVYQEHQTLLAPPHEVHLPSLRAPRAEFAEGAPFPILVAPDSLHWKKRWIVGHWEEFFDLALKALPNVEFTLVGSPRVFPQDLLDHLRHKYQSRFKNRLGLLPLSDLPRIASQHRLTLCGNSAWQHISESVGVPVISLPGPIVASFGFSPFLPQSRELDVKLPCRPCTRHGGGNCHRTGAHFHACMKLIQPQSLLELVKEKIS